MNVSEIDPSASETSFRCSRLVWALTLLGFIASLNNPNGIKVASYNPRTMTQ